ncbi:MarR family winged helix-turn-helix transcriptional regulator [Nocardioides solisilvae]|uniref:MarR family winged helix-turn-helix transcriptional regulator n=1 Tax=Nocardioides solisilvae TaxID=1542435 RepID=UPI000D74ECDF|nr:MarR family transcriptional regulator [Nocardioides solisilvae]
MDERDPATPGTPSAGTPSLGTPSLARTPDGRSWDQTGSLLVLREVLARSQRLHRAVAQRAGLTDRELEAMAHLAREALGPAEVARRLDVSTAASTGIVDRLVARGHAERRPHPGDRRRTEVHVTDSGRREAAAHLRPMFVALDELDRGFSDADRAVVERYLRGVLEAFDRVLEPDEQDPRQG